MEEIFKIEPEQWGLRGDPYLWKDMASYFSSINEPETELLFTILFYKAFKKLTGEALEPGKMVFVERYSHGGMSSGVVDTSYWLQVAYPLLLERYKVMLTWKKS